jgi:hypothetical protein
MSNGNSLDSEVIRRPAVPLNFQDTYKDINEDNENYLSNDISPRTFGEYEM